MAELGEHEGREIVGTTLSVQKVGAGLDNPLAIDPEVIEVGDERVLCVPVQCVDVHHRAEDRKEPSKGGLVRVHVFDATTAFFIDPGIVVEARQSHAEKVHLAEQARDRAKLKVSKPVEVDDEQQALEVDAESLEAAHLDGKHALGLVEGCPACDFEGETVENERAEDELAAKRAAAAEASDD